MSCTALLFLAPFTFALRGSLPIWAAAVWSAAWSIAAILLSFRADPTASVDVRGNLGVLLFFNVAGMAAAALLVFLFRFFRRQIEPRP